MSRFMKSAALLALAFALFACASNPERGVVNKSGEIDKEWTEQGITENFIFSRGIGAADQTLTNTTQRRATSRDSAIVSAQYNMLSLIKGVKLEGGITVEKAMETDSILATSIDATIKGAQVVRSEWTADDGCVIILRLSKKALKEMGLKMIQD